MTATNLSSKYAATTLPLCLTCGKKMEQISANVDECGRCRDFYTTEDRLSIAGARRTAKGMSSSYTTPVGSYLNRTSP